MTAHLHDASAYSARAVATSSLDGMRPPSMSASPSIPANRSDISRMTGIFMNAAGGVDGCGAAAAAAAASVAGCCGVGDGLRQCVDACSSSHGGVAVPQSAPPVSGLPLRVCWRRRKCQKVVNESGR